MVGCGIKCILSFLPAVGKFLYAVELFIWRINSLISWEILKIQNYVCNVSTHCWNEAVNVTSGHSGH
jgi:hypothetical protein